jgi:hypothetical protein
MDHIDNIDSGKDLIDKGLRNWTAHHPHEPKA